MTGQITLNLPSIVMHGIDFSAIVKEAHETAKEKGWWEEGVAERSIADQVANFHAEVSEAWEEYRAGRMETQNLSHAPFKPEGFWVEVADVIIRVGDTVGAYGLWLMTLEGKHDMPTPVGRFVNTLHFYICSIPVNGEKGLGVISAGAKAMSMILNFCAEYAAAEGKTQVLMDAITAKLAYNKTRPHRHGNKKA